MDRHCQPCPNLCTTPGLSSNLSGCFPVFLSKDCQLGVNDGDGVLKDVNGSGVICGSSGGITKVSRSVTFGVQCPLPLLSVLSKKQPSACHLPLCHSSILVDSRYRKPNVCSCFAFLLLTYLCRVDVSILSYAFSRISPCIFIDPSQIC